MAALAQAPEVLPIPEQRLITAMGRLVIRHHVAPVSLSGYDTTHLACEQVAAQYLPAQATLIAGACRLSLPPCEVVPGAVFLRLRPVSVARLLSCVSPYARW